MKKLIFIGSCSLNKYNIIGGEIKKNQELLRCFDNMRINHILIDIEKYKSKNPLKMLILMIRFLVAFLWPFPRIILVSKHPLGAQKIIKLSKALNVFKKKIVYLVIGGAFPRYIKEGYIDAKYFLDLPLIIVETRKIMKQLKELGLKNVICKPNFKRIVQFESNYSGPGNTLRLVYLSRIMPKKGVEFIIDVLSEINKSKGKIFEIDFYGPIDSSYDLNSFSKLIRKYNFAKYKGVLNMDDPTSYKILNSYDLFIFPTMYSTEGFPGALIDAMIAEIPILASDVDSTKEIVNEKIGYLFKCGDKKDLIYRLISIYENRNELFERRKYIKFEKSKYDSNKICKEISNEIFDL